MGEVAAHADALRQGFARGARWARQGIAELEALVNEVADRLHPRPAAADGAEVRPGEIGKKVRLAISARPKERQRIVGQVRRRDRFSSGVDLILPSIGAKDALKTQ